MGRSRGGLTTKIHALVDAEGLPIALRLTEGQAHDNPTALEMMGSLNTGDILLADRAYDSDALRRKLADQGAWANETDVGAPQSAGLQPIPLSLSQSGRTLLQQAQTLPSRRHPL